MNTDLPKKGPELSLECFSYELIQNAHWAELEKFSIDVLREYYRPFGLKIKRTKKTGETYGGDGARDGEASYVFASDPALARAGPMVENLGLGVLITLWVEVKKRSKGNIDRHDVGGTILSSSEEQVTKILFVTNRDFTKPFRKQLAKYALRNSIQFALINGRNLVSIAEGVTGNPGSAGKSIGSKNPNSRIAVETHLSLDPLSLSVDERPRIECSIGDPIFLIADCYVEGLVKRFSELALDITYSGKQPPRIVPRLGKLQHGVSVGDSFRAEFLVIPEDPCDLRSDQFVLKVSDEEGSDVDCRKLENNETCRTYGTILPASILPSRESLYRGLTERISTWKRSGGIADIDVIAIAGAGKSHLIRHIRPHWLESDANEIFLDGGKTNSVSEAVFSLLTQSFPIPLDGLSEDLANALTQWLKRSGISELQAESLGRSLCKVSNNWDLALNDEQLGRIVALVLAKRSEPRKKVLVFEDLHKCTPPLISLLKTIRDHLRTWGKGNILTLFTSREDSVWNDESMRSSWRASMENMSSGGNALELRISSLTKIEALDLLQESIPTIEAHYAEEIVKQVGTTPFAIREVLGLLIERGALQPTAKNGIWHLMDPEALKETLHTKQLQKATHYRLRGLCERYPEWLGDFLDSGACIGPSFDLAVASENAGAQNPRALEKALAECRSLEILRLSPFSPSDIHFDHDLIRLVLLEDMGAARQRRLAGGLVNQLKNEASLNLLSSLSYQAGLAEKCWEYSLRQVEKAKQVKRHLEAVQALSLALAVTDNNVSSMIFDVRDGRYRPSFDDAIAVAEPTIRPGLTRRDRETETARLLLKYVEHLVQVGSGGTPTVSRALTEGAMLAERLRDGQLKGAFLMYHGRQEFNQNNPSDSLVLHKKAEEIFARLEQSEETSRLRAVNLVRLAIAQRSMDELEASRTTLVTALKQRPGRSWDLATQVRANFGATYFYIDWTKTRHHWNQAVRIAERVSLTDRHVHGLIDIASLDLLEDRVNEAESGLNRAYAISRESGYENSELRCLLNLGCVFLIDNDLRRALDYFRDADRLGFRHQIARRLWRVRANMATTYYVLGEIEQSAVTDKIVLGSLLSAVGSQTPATPFHIIRTRMVLALVNIALRAELSTDHASIISSLPAELAERSCELARTVLDDRLEKMPGLISRHCKLIDGKRFFVITE